MTALGIPTKKGPHGEEIDTRPIYVEEWLETLPYIDSEKTCDLLLKALQATNRQQVKPTVRLELVELYNRPYQYYIDSQIKTGAQHTQQTIDAMLRQVQPLKQIAVQLSYASKLAGEDALTRKTIWKQAKPPLQAMLMSLTYLSHALIFSFLEYAPTPMKVWNELNLLYSFAERLGIEKTMVELPGYKGKTRTSVEHAYKRIILASLADPYHLPFGAIWEIYNQLNEWAECCQLQPFHGVDNPTGYFVVNLNSDTKPVPYTKFERSNADEMHRLLDTTPLENVIQQYVNQIKAGKPIDSSIKLSPNYVRTLMGHMLKSWGLPPKRYLQRHTRTGQLELVCGLNPLYFFCNGQNDFVQTSCANQDNEDELYTDEIIRANTRSSPSFTSEKWQIVDEGAGGYALIHNDLPKNPVRVGDLIGTQDRELNHRNWTLGIIRWLMIGKNKLHKIGIQNLTTSANPGAIRACNGSRLESEYRRALISGPNGGGEEFSVITDKGLYLPGRQLEVELDDRKTRVTAGDLVESTVGFEYFKCKPE